MWFELERTTKAATWDATTTRGRAKEKVMEKMEAWKEFG